MNNSPEGSSGTKVDGKNDGDVVLSQTDIENLSIIEKIADSTNRHVPVLLQQLYSECKPQSLIDALLLPIHCIALECGFIPDPAKTKEQLTNGFGVRGVVQLLYHLVGHETSVCNVTLVKINDLVVIHGRPGHEEHYTCKVTLMVEMFVETLGPTDASVAYKHLLRLSCDMKNSIFLPLRGSLREVLGYSEEGFSGLPTELKLRVLCWLRGADLVQTSLVSRELYALSRDPAPWRAAYARDFGGINNMNLRRDWLTLYKERYAARREHARRLQSEEVLIPSPFPHELPIPGYMPGVLGGGYDLDPFSSPGSLFRSPFIRPWPGYNALIADPHFPPARWLPPDPSRVYLPPGGWMLDD